MTRYYAIEAVKNNRRQFWDAYPNLMLARKAAKDAAADGWICTILREVPRTSGTIGTQWEIVRRAA